MPRYVALLRGIMPMNPDHRMEKLRGVIEDLGFTSVQSVIASGNIIFDTDRTDRKQLESDIETALLKANGVETATILRTEEEIKQLIETDPFTSVADLKKHRPNVTFFKSAPDKSKLPKEGKDFTGYGFVADAYCYTIDMSTMKTPDAMLALEREFGKGITTRTWGTVEKVWKKIHSNNHRAEPRDA